MDVHELFNLASHGPDTFVGAGPRYPWGGLYGGQIVAQALRAAGATVDPDLHVHSLRAYFIRRGDHHEPVRYEVDRTRNGRSFCTRRVIARQAIGAILNLEASFQAVEPSADIQTVPAPPSVPQPEDILPDSWTPLFDRRAVPADALPPAAVGAGRAAAWIRLNGDLGDDPLLHACSLAYVSDDLPTDAVVRAHPLGEVPQGDRLDGWFFSASLDHTVWFHRPVRSDEWCLHDFSCHNFGGGRGLSIGHVFARSGVHVATVAQEVVMRDPKERSDGSGRG